MFSTDISLLSTMLFSKEPTCTCALNEYTVFGNASLLRITLECNVDEAQMCKRALQRKERKGFCNVSI